VEEAAGASWQDFEACLAVLVEAGALAPAATDGTAEQQQQEKQQQVGVQLAGEQQAAAQQAQSEQQRPEEQQQEQHQQFSQDRDSWQQEERPGDGANGLVDSEAADAAQLLQDWQGRIEFLPLGLVARDINCANEIWAALVLCHPAVQALAPPQLAGVLSAGGWAVYLSVPLWPCLLYGCLQRVHLPVPCHPASTFSKDQRALE
jgi:hypothetical protein